MSTPTVGDAAPEFTLLDQHEAEVSLAGLSGRKVLVYFSPRADTPGCTTQACGLRDIHDRVGGTVIIGISPDTPAKLEKFDDKYGLGFSPLSDIEHEVAEQFGVWVEKKNYGKTYMGVQRSAFLIDESGKVAEAVAAVTSLARQVTAWAFRASRSTNSRADTWVLSSTTGQARPASNASDQRAAHTHH